MAGLRVSDRDLKVLLDLYENVFLSFNQIKEVHFKNRAKPTVYNRLSKLVKSDLIKVLSVNLNMEHRHHQDVGVVYQITRLGLSILKNYLPQKIFREMPVPINMSALYHDLLLTDVLRKMRKSYPDFEIVNGKLEANEFKNSSKMPDAIIKDQSSSDEFALELELTVKSEKRYRDIVFNYQMDSRYKSVLYLVQSAQIRSKIGGIASGFGKSYQRNDDTKKFYFCTLDQFLSNNSQVNFDNGKSDFCRKECSMMYAKEVV